jgi:hypothetical protein
LALETRLVTRVEAKEYRNPHGILIDTRLPRHYIDGGAVFFGKSNPIPFAPGQFCPG